MGLKFTKLQAKIYEKVNLSYYRKQRTYALHAKVVFVNPVTLQM